MNVFPPPPHNIELKSFIGNIVIRALKSEFVWAMENAQNILRVVSLVSRELFATVRFPQEESQFHCPSFLPVLRAYISARLLFITNIICGHGSDSCGEQAYVLPFL